MYYNTIRLLKGERRYGKKAFDKYFSKGDTIFGDGCEPVEIARWKAEDKEEAEAALAKYKCEYHYGELQNTYYVTEYGLEYCDCDEDGEWEAGSDFDIAVTNITWEVWEDNAGGLHLVVFDFKDNAAYIHSGYETAGDQLLEDIELLKSGEADPVNDWDGNAEDPQGLYDELMNSRETSIVADNDGIYYSKMGNAAASIFGDGENE